jgi:hypothetical protein
MRLVSLIHHPNDFVFPEDVTTSFRRRLSFMYWVGSDLRTARTVTLSDERKRTSEEFLRQLLQGFVVCTVTAHLLTHEPSFGLLNKTSVLKLVWRWFISFGFFYNSLLMVDVVYNFPLLTASIVVQPMMDRPLMSSSLREFWAVRWDRAVQMMLKDSVYSPLRRYCGCSSSVAVFGTFMASGALHCYGIMCGGCFDLKLCASIFAFFSVQPLLLYLESITENKFSLTWILVVASPLFLEPVCKLFELQQMKGSR